jgi:hypothetical protein
MDQGSSPLPQTQPLTQPLTQEEAQRTASAVMVPQISMGSANNQPEIPDTAHHQGLLAILQPTPPSRIAQPRPQSFQEGYMMANPPTEGIPSNNQQGIPLPEDLQFVNPMDEYYTQVLQRPNPEVFQPQGFNQPHQYHNRAQYQTEEAHQRAYQMAVRPQAWDTPPQKTVVSPMGRLRKMLEDTLREQREKEGERRKKEDSATSSAPSGSSGRRDRREESLQDFTSSPGSPEEVKVYPDDQVNLEPRKKRGKRISMRRRGQVSATSQVRKELFPPRKDDSSDADEEESSEGSPPVPRNIRGEKKEGRETPDLILTKTEYINLQGKKTIYHTCEGNGEEYNTYLAWGRLNIPTPAEAGMLREMLRVNPTLKARYERMSIHNKPLFWAARENRNRTLAARRSSHLQSRRGREAYGRLHDSDLLDNPLHGLAPTFPE